MTLAPARGAGGGRGLDRTVTVEDGHGNYIPNADSACVDITYSGLTAGTNGGLVTGAYQEAPDPAFDEAGNATADAIFAPVTFFAVAFAGATDSAETMPMLTATEGVLTGDLSAFTAYYGGGSFNQGAPKPDGTGEAPMGTITPRPAPTCSTGRA